MTFWDRFFIELQYLLGRLAVVVTVPLIFLAIRLFGYRIRDVRKVRAEIARLQEAHEGPWLICPNHLTMIDSALISYGMLSFTGHMLHFRRVAWNLPERDNFQRNLILATLCYLAKCLPVNRCGNRDELQKVLEKCRYLLGKKQSLMIFPEGGRSRVGRVDRENYSYGVGRFVEECPNVRVLLVYLRGDGQKEYGNLPRFGERFTMAVESFDPGREEGSGLRVQREYARRIVERLADLEDRYFAPPG
ncbi:MAG: lysophospholipid acyltransferase family protein [Deltaproteobacteria bacterium]|nr:lysophospholipid acyltransferase family protein [Deltaproteobacteria bacterium]